jgi:DNA-binding response OmpR family regulator
MSSKEISVLIVEDHYPTRDGLTAFLGDEFTCFAAANAEEAMRLLGARYFNLVLTDIHLPGASGLEVCRLVRKMSLDTVVMVMTGMNDIEYRTMAMRQGALYHIEKPINPEKLLIWVKTALRCQALARGRRLYEDGKRGSTGGQGVRARSSPRLDLN